MSFSENLVILVGGLGRDAETRFTTNDVSVTSFSIATENSYKDKSGDWQKTTTWHNCVAFGLSDWIKDKLKKGEKIYLRGRISNTKYEKDGETKYKSEVIVDSRTINPLGRRSEASSQSQTQETDETPF